MVNRILHRCLRADSNNIRREREAANHSSMEKTRVVAKALKVELEKGLNMMETNFPATYLMINQESATEGLPMR